MEIELSDVVAQVESYIDLTEDARKAAEKARDYRDHKQWSEDEAKALKDRGQAPIVNNRIATKIDYLLGVEASQRTDPRAIPRTMEHEDAANAVTDALRFVEDQCEFDQSASDCFEDYAVEGTTAVLIECEKTEGGKYKISADPIPWDRYYYDPAARKNDLSDKTFDGIVLWLDIATVKRRFKEKAGELESIMEGSDDFQGTTFEDKPKWIDRKRKRIRVCQHYFLHEDVWHVGYFTSGLWLRDPEPCGYVDEHGKPMNPIESVSLYVDRENNRYGFVAGLLDMQDEINHRRSKALFLLSARQTFSNQMSGVGGDNLHVLKRELSKPNGHVEMQTGEFGKDFGIIPTNDMADAQFQMLAEAKSEIDNLGVAAIMSQSDANQLSGRAKLIDNNQSLMQLGRMFDRFSNWKKRVYKQFWYRIRQFWDEETWFRVTDNEESSRWVGLNVPVTMIEKMAEEKTGLDLAEVRKKFGAEIMQMSQQNPQLGQTVETRNDVVSMDVDINIETAPDTMTIQQEQFEVISALAQAYAGTPDAIPFEFVLRLSSLRNKKEILDKMKGDPVIAEQQAQEQAIVKQLMLEKEGAEIDLTEAKTKSELAKAQKTQTDAGVAVLEAMLLQARPDITPNVII